MKVLKLSKGQAAYIIAPEDCEVTVSKTSVTQKGKRFFLVRVI